MISTEDNNTPPDSEPIWSVLTGLIALILIVLAIIVTMNFLAGLGVVEDPTSCGYRWTEDARYVEHHFDGDQCVPIQEES